MTYESTSPAKANTHVSGPTPEEFGRKWGAFAGHVLALRQSESIARLPEHEQGRVIADRYVGAVVAGQTRGQFNDRAGRGFTSVNDVFQRVNHAARTPNVRTTIRETFPDTSDLKVGTTLLLEDDVTKSFMPELTGRVKEDQHGRVTMISAEQVVGYTEAIANGVYRPWQKPLLDEVTRCMGLNHPEPNPKWDSYGEFSDVKTVQDDRDAWRGIVDAASRDGVDFQMLTRSVNQMYRDGLGANREAMAEPVTPQVPSYDHLFQP